MNDSTEITRKILGDHWEGVLNHEWTIEKASSADLDRALDQLDAHTYTMITVQLDKERHLTIGGGAGQYVVYATFGNEVFWNLLRPQPTIGMVLLNVGGQQGDFPAAQVVDKEHARVAGHVFLSACHLNSAQQWEKQ